MITDRLGVSEQQDAARLERVVKHRQQLLLQLAVHVDEHVATADHVEPREWRIARQIVPGEDAEVAERLRDAIAAVGLGEESSSRSVGTSEAIGRG